MTVSLHKCTIAHLQLRFGAVDWADLVTLDLSQYDLPGGKQKLASQLQDAVHRVGFLYDHLKPDP